MKLLVASWKAVTQETVTNCFKKAGVTSETQRAAITGPGNPFKDLQEILDALKAADSDMVPEGLSAEKVINVDHDVIATAPCITEDDIIVQFQTHQAVSDKDGNDCDEKTVNDVAPE